MKEKNRAPIFPPFEVKGRFATALVYAQTVDEKAVAQIIALCNQPFAKGTPIRVMPDVHTGAGCVIGLTMDLSRSDAVCPNLVGVDIGCGVRVSELGRVTLDWQRLDDVIREFVPSGQNVHRQTYREDADFFHSLFNALFIKDRIKRSEKMEWLERSLGTLGGGNHFIEVDTDNEGRAYLIVHSGSRHFGLTVAKLYQESAIDHVKKYEKTYREKNQAMARALAAQGRSRELYGERETVSRATQRILRTYFDWGALQETGTKGVYSAGKTIAVKDPQLAVWLIEAALYVRVNRSAPLKELFNNPCLFPIRIKPMHAENLEAVSPKLDLFRHGLDNELIILKKLIL